MEKNLGGITKKFLFDLNDFDEAAIRAREVAARKPTFSQEEMAASRQTGFDEGRIAGMQETIASQEAQIRDIMQQIATHAERLSMDEADRMASFIDQAALVAVQGLSKALPVLMDILSTEQISRFVSDVLDEHAKSQSLIVYVSSNRENVLRERIEADATAHNRKANLEIKADPTLHDLQCRIEWTGGGAEWNPQDVATHLLETILTHLPEHLKTQTAAQEAVAPETQTQAHIDETPQTPHSDSESPTSGDAS